MNWTIQYSPDTNFSQINLQISHNPNQNPCRIYFNYRKVHSKIYMEKQRNRISTTMFEKWSNFETSGHYSTLRHSIKYQDRIVLVKR